MSVVLISQWATYSKEFQMVCMTAVDKVYFCFNRFQKLSIFWKVCVILYSLVKPGHKEITDKRYWPLVI